MTRCAAEQHAAGFDAPGANVAGTWLTPDSRCGYAVLIGGTLSRLRDGGLGETAAPRRDALLRLALALAGEGWASLRYDRVGWGQSKALPGWKGTYREEARVAAAALEKAREEMPEAPVIAIGESAGAYIACLAAREGLSVDGYIFLGPLCGPARELYDFNYGRLARWADESPENLMWALERAPRDLAIGRRFKEMLEAAAQGRDEIEFEEKGVCIRMPLARRAEEILWPPDEMFRHIEQPALVLSGELDMNVPSEHGAKAAWTMQQSGNRDAISVQIPLADHSFQLAADDPDERLRERYSFHSFNRPYSPELYKAIGTWLCRFVSKA